MKRLFTFLSASLLYVAAGAQCDEITTAFEDSTSGPTVYLFDQSSTANGWLIEERIWNYGDSTVDSTVLNPVHTYMLPGLYTVYLTIYGKLPGDSGTQLNCQEVVYRQVAVTSTGIADIDGDGLVIFPNPSNGYIQISTHEVLKGVYIYSMEGQLLSALDLTDNPKEVSNPIELPQKDFYHSYFVRVETLRGNVVKQILVSE